MDDLDGLKLRDDYRKLQYRIERLNLKSDRKEKKKKRYKPRNLRQRKLYCNLKRRKRLF